jgi:hypothetical protein
MFSINFGKLIGQQEIIVTRRGISFHSRYFLLVLLAK